MLAAGGGGVLAREREVEKDKDNLTTVAVEIFRRRWWCKHLAAEECGQFP